MPRLLPRRTIETILNDIPVSRIDSAEEMRLLCQHIGHSANADVRHQVWDITISGDNPYAATGCVSSKFALRAFAKACESLGAQCDCSRVTALPDDEIGDMRVGLVVSAECPVRDKPGKGERFDTAVFGGSLFLLRRGDAHSLVHSETGYVGWVDNLHYRRVHKDEWLEWAKHERAVFVGAWSKDGIEIAPGTELPILPSRDALLPTGSKIPISDEDNNYVIPQNQEQRKALLVVGRSLLGTPYVWGGTTPKGIDCSGFLRYIYQSIGFALPRDADQQYLCGKISGLPGMMEAIRAGDLLFFAGDHGRICHVAMAIDSESFIHADGKRGVTVARWDHESKRLETFLAAKRVIR